MKDDFRFKHGSIVIRCGFTQIPNLLIRGRKRLRLSVAEWELAIHLMSYEFDSMSSRPALTTICSDAGMSSATIHKAKKGLEQKGYLKIERAKNRFGTNQYDLSGLRIAVRRLAQRRLEEDRIIRGRISAEDYERAAKTDTAEDVLFRN